MLFCQICFVLGNTIFPWDRRLDLKLRTKSQNLQEVKCGGAITSNGKFIVFSLHKSSKVLIQN